MNAMSRPRNAAPKNAIKGAAAIANTTSAANRILSPCSSSVRAERIGKDRIGNIHHYHDCRPLADRKADAQGAKNMERLTETSEGKYCSKGDDQPIPQEKTFDFGQDQVFFGTGGRLRGLGFVHCSGEWSAGTQIWAEFAPFITQCFAVFNSSTAKCARNSPFVRL